MQEPKHNANDAKNFLNNIKKRNETAAGAKKPDSTVIERCREYSALKLIEEADNAAENGDFATAAALSQLALKKEPQNPFALYAAATFCLNLEDYPNCLKYIKLLIKQQEQVDFKDFDRKLLQYRLGDAFYFNGYYEKAKVFYETLLEEGYLEFGIFTQLGLIYYSEEDYDTALMFFIKAYETDPDDMYVNTYIAAAYAKKEKYHTALEFIFRAEELGYTDDIYMYEEVSRIYYCLEDYDKSLLYAQKVLEKDKNSAIGLRRLGWAHYELKDDPDTVYDCFKKAIDGDCYDDSMFYVLICHYLETGDKESAKKYAALMKKANPDCERVYFADMEEKSRAMLFGDRGALVRYYVKLVLFCFGIVIIMLCLL